MFDTHCHLNFSAFKNNVEKVIDEAKTVGVNTIVVPGTDYESSKRAVEIAEKHNGIYAAVGIHPHHVFEIIQKSKVKSQNLNSKVKSLIKQIEELLSNRKVVAIGEIGLDRHYYQKTKYKNYQINEELIELQKLFFLEQIKLANKYRKMLIIHNREAKNDLLDILNSHYSLLNSIHSVFHCCEPDEELLTFAKEHKIFIGVDGDVTYDKKKQEFVKRIPIELLVLETDSPYLLPEPLRSKKLFPNEPKNLPLIAEYISKIFNISMIRIIKITTENAKRLFQLVEHE